MKRYGQPAVFSLAFEPKPEAHVKNKRREYCYSAIVACQPCFFSL
jgi:hypothetical protein